MAIYQSQTSLTNSNPGSLLRQKSQNRSQQAAIGPFNELDKSTLTDPIERPVAPGSQKVLAIKPSIESDVGILPTKVTTNNPTNVNPVGLNNQQETPITPVVPSSSSKGSSGKSSGGNNKSSNDNPSKPVVPVAAPVNNGSVGQVLGTSTVAPSNLRSVSVYGPTQGPASPVKAPTSKTTTGGVIASGLQNLLKSITNLFGNKTPTKSSKLPNNGAGTYLA